MRRIRRSMLRRELPAECSACETRNSPYFGHFNNLFGHLKPELKKATSRSGRVRAKPISFDHRLSNHCNFKCHMCSSRYSSSWEREIAALRGDYSLPDWQREPKKSAVRAFQRDVSEKELVEAIETKSVREIYWAGGEPLLLEAHWKHMQRIIELGIADQVHIRYNTNFSTLTYRGQHLFRDILRHFPNFSIGASLDATGKIGEYLRTGLHWESWKKNLQEALAFVDQKKKVLSIAHTITTPGLLDLRNMLELSAKYDLPLATQLIEVNTPQAVMSPLSPLVFPKNLRQRFIEEILAETWPLRTVLSQSTFAELENLACCQGWPEIFPREHKNALRAGISHMRQTENYRNRSQAGPTYFEILAAKPYLRDWLAQFIMEES